MGQKWGRSLLKGFGSPQGEVECKGVVSAAWDPSGTAGTGLESPGLHEGLGRQILRLLDTSDTAGCHRRGENEGGAHRAGLA